MISRRGLIKNCLASLVAVKVPTSAFSAKNVSRYRIIAQKSEHQFYEGANLSDLFLYNGSSPGPLIVENKGNIQEVEFLNLLDEPSSIHWHGIRNLNDMDGVPGLTQAPVEPGETFTYRFPLNDAGTFWYHSHSQAWNQVARGLCGPLIVLEDGSSMSDRDLTIAVDDWLLDENEQIHTASLGSLHDWSHGGRLGNFLTINGKSAPEIKIPKSGKVHLRFLNFANARVMQFELNDRLPMRIVALDGAPCDPFVRQRLTLAPAQRVDVQIDDVSFVRELFEVSTGEEYGAATFVPNEVNQKPNALPRFVLPTNNMLKMDNAEVINIHMQGGAMGNLSSAIFEGEQKSLRELARSEKKLWAFNGEIGGYDLTLAEVDLGKTVVLRVWNDTRWQHGMHLHGHHFWVKSKEFGDEANLVLRDTYLMQPGEHAELVFEANNPGSWLFHCHMLEHHVSGMGGIITVG